MIRRRPAPLVMTLASALLALPLATLRAQCADGSPPPCKSPTVAAAPRRANPPLDDRTWIVVPFDNLANASDVDWLRGAAVNLLYLDMSRWRDIRVIDDERVADLLREAPTAGQASPNMSLATATAVAKQAGAGRLVMGDVLKIGSRTTVTAKVFDVKTGQRLRSVREETTVADSLMPLFGRLARKILNLAPPRGANVGALGTTSVDAYQAYIAGVTALNRYDLAEARRQFDAAIRIDSTFALAHHKQAIVIGWANAGDPTRRTHADAANRLSAGLPARERALITGHLQQTSGEWTKSCDTYSALVTADSSDVEAWYGVGDCLFHDPTLEAVGGDSTKLRFRADWDRSIKAFSRVLQLDATNHLAYQHIIDALTPERHAAACLRATPSAPCTFHSAFLIRTGDSLTVRPVAMTDTAALRVQAEQYVQTASRRRNLDLARTFADAWVQAAPTEPQAHRALARVLVLQGKVAEADLEMAQIRTRGTFQEELRRIMERMEIAYKLWRGAEVARLYDSVRTTNIPLPGASFSLGNVISGYGPAIGRIVEFDSVIGGNMRAGGAPDVVQRYQRYTIRSALMGEAHDSLVAAERAAFEQTLARGASAATRMISGSLALSLRAPRSSWPAIDTTVRDPKLRPAVALSQGDSAKLRAAAQALDSIAAMMSSAGASDSGYSVIAAEAYLALRDSTAALRSLRFALDVSIATTSYFPQGSSGPPPVFFVPRTMLMRADLAAGLGLRDEARLWYRRFIDVWSTAAPELQPLVERARKSLAALGGAT